VSEPASRRAVVLVDGEHYPPVVRAALDDLRLRGVEAVAALFLGGTEKVAAEGASVDLGVPIEWVRRPAGWTGAGVEQDAAVSAMNELIGRHGPDLIMDLSDEPVIDQRRRMWLAAHALACGVAYEGSDFRFTPPGRPRIASRPTIAVIGTGKRTGKTAVGGDIARRLIGQGRTPVLVAMGRGGPPEPVVVPAGTLLDPTILVEVADNGGHAASDFYEDALTTGAATVGARRCGGGLAGTVGHSNVAAAVRASEELPADVVLLEGSGSAIPPAHADATVLVVPADIAIDELHGHLGPFRVLLADLVVVTMCEPPRASAVQVESVLEAIRSISRSAAIVRTVLRPEPLGEVDDADVFFATTAPPAVRESLVRFLEQRFRCRVVAASSQLADRPALRTALQAAPAFDVLLVELKAAAVDVATRMATEAGARVVFCDNRPLVVAPGDGDKHRSDPYAGVGATTLSAEVERLVRLADDRFATEASAVDR
jgi:cyclic 2,3-diphosphoglycerate synthase